MVRIEPVDLLFGHDTHLDEVRVIETEGEGLKGQPLVFGGRRLGLFGGNDSDQVLCADTPFTGAVYTRFIRDDMSDLEGRRVIVRTYVLRAFVAA